jgi:hypothetical protein
MATEEEEELTTGQKKPGVFIPKGQPTEGTPEPERVAGPVTRGLQSALIGQAFESFGKAFTGGGYTPVGQAKQTPGGMQNWRDAGNQVQAALEQRWYQAEFKNLRNAELKDFQSDMQGLIEESKFLNKELDRGIWHEAGAGPDSPITRLDLKTEEGRLEQVQLRGQLQADMVHRVGEMQINLGNVAREKYRSNPLINNMIEEMYKHTSKSLLTQFNPAAAMANAEAVSGLRVDEAQIRQLDAQGRASDASAKERANKPPEGLHEAYKQGGAAGLDAFMNGTDKGLGLFEQVRGSYEKEVQEEFERNWRKENKKVTINRAAKMKADFANSQDSLRRLVMYRWVRATLGKDIAEELAKQNPGYGPGKVATVEPAVKGALSPKEAESKANKFAGIALDRYIEWMAEQPPETTMEEGIDFIMKQWLPEALDGNVPEYEEHGEYITDNLTAGATKAAEAYRALVRARVADQLKENAGAGKGGKKLKEHQRVGKTRPMGPGKRRATALGSLTRGLFNEDEYPEKAPRLPPEPEI